jgi:Kef-type K+ transport system membrane component KefB
VLQQLKLIVLLLVGIFFLCVGILLLISTYQLTNPFAFIITFFAANLMILISATLALGFALRIIKNHRNRSKKNNPSADQD